MSDCLEENYLTISGRISDSEDVDVFEIRGPFDFGQRFIANPEMGNDLLASVGIFYEGEVSGETLLINDHRNIYLGRHGPFGDISLREYYPSLYLTITSTPGFTSSGSYDFSLRKQDLLSLQDSAYYPRSNPDIVLLDFDGAQDVRIGTRFAVDIPPLEESWLVEAYPGQIEEIKRIITERIRQDYSSYNVQIYTTDETSFESGMTRVYFGGYDPALLGVAESVDEYNYELGQEALVYVERFQAFNLLNPTAEQISIAIANVGSHEAGHLLGLVHTDDPVEIMDVTASLTQMLLD